MQPQNKYITRPSVRLIITLILGLIVYFNTLYYPFHYDDFGVAIETNIIEDGLFEFWLNKSGIFSHRLFLLFSFELNYHLGGGGVVGYHAVNIAFHILNSILIYLILINILKHDYSFKAYRKTSNREIKLKSVPFFSSLIFALHPLNTETVTFISSRSSGMCTFFFLLSFYFFIRGMQGLSNQEIAKSKTVVYFSSSLLAFLAGLGTKEIIATLPAIVVLYLYYFANKERNVFIFLSKFKGLLMSVALPIVGYLAYRKIISGAIFTAQADAGASIYGRYYYFLTEIKVIIFYYLKLFIFPINLNIFPMMRASTSIFEPVLIISLLIILVLVTIGIALNWKERSVESKMISFSILWFFITLLPSSSFIPLMDPIAEHRSYLPVVGASIFSGTLFSVFISSSLVSTQLKHFKILPIVFILLLFSMLNIQRNFVWKDGHTLWTDSAQKTPEYARPHINLGLEFNKRGLNDLAVKEFQKAVDLFPENSESHYGLGKVYFDLGRFKDALSEFVLAVQYDRDSFKSIFALANSYSKTGEYDKAVDAYKKANRVFRRVKDKEYLEAIHNLGMVYGMMGQLDSSIQQFQKVLEVDPDHKMARENLSRAFKYMGNIKKPGVEKKNKGFKQPLRE